MITTNFVLEMASKVEKVGQKHAHQPQHDETNELRLIITLFWY